MTSNRNRLDGFEERLLRELKSVVAQRKAEQSSLTRARTPLWRRPRVVSVASAGALAIGAAIGVPLLGGETTTPPASAAYEITANDDGTVTVTIYRFSDADGLEERLEDHGVPADVTYTPYGKRCQADRFELSPTQHKVTVEYGGRTIDDAIGDLDEVELSFTLRPADLQPEETVVVVNDFWGSEIGDPESDLRAQRIHEANVATAIGPVEPCELEPDPEESADALVEQR